MKLAEALILRADAQKRIAQLRDRLMRNSKVQQGEAPSEDPQDLLAELKRALVNLNTLVQRINRTNSQTLLSDGKTLTDVLADRDSLVMERTVLSAVIQSAMTIELRYSLTEIKMVSTINIRETQTRVDELAQQHRELDTVIQRINWETELL